MEATAAREIYDAMLLNQASDELTRAVKDLRLDEPAAAGLVRHADLMSMEVRDRMFDLIRKHPENHDAVIAVLRRTLELIDQDRSNPRTTAAQRWDLHFVEKYVREIGREVLRQHLPLRAGGLAG